MPSAVLIVASTRVHADVQEILRIQDTASYLLSRNWAVDLLIPRHSRLLAAALPRAVRVLTIPRVPFMDDPPKRPSVRRLLAGVLMFLRGIALAPRRNYTILHGLNDGAIVARAIGCGTVRRLPYVADIQNPFCARALYHGLYATIARALERHSLRHSGDWSPNFSLRKPLPRSRAQPRSFALPPMSPPSVEASLPKRSDFCFCP